MDYRKYLGQAGEDYACRFIEEQGLEVLERNWRDSNRGELDILAREGNTAVVVEVRTRVGIGYGSALESIDTRKVLKLRRLAAQWARQRRLFSKLRIDIIALTVPRACGQELREGGTVDFFRYPPKIEWLRGIA